MQSAESGRSPFFLVFACLCLIMKIGDTGDLNMCSRVAL